MFYAAWLVRCGAVNGGLNGCIILTHGRFISTEIEVGNTKAVIEGKRYGKGDPD